MTMHPKHGKNAGVGSGKIGQNDGAADMNSISPSWRNKVFTKPIYTLLTSLKIALPLIFELFSF